MVEQAINVAPTIVSFNPTEVTFQLSCAKADLQKIDCAPQRDVGIKQDFFYDYVFNSSGVDAITPVDVHHRSLRYDPTLENKLAVPSFFTGVIEDLTSKLNAFVRLNYNNDIDIDVFFAYAAGAGAVTYDAYFWTVDNPNGLTDPKPDINNFVHYEVIPINQAGNVRKYLVVGLALP